MSIAAATPTANRELVRRLYDDFINTGRRDQLAELVSPDFVGPGELRGPAAFAAPIEILRAAFPDLHYTTEDIVAEGDRVAVRWSWRGTFTNAFRTFAPTGKRMANSGFAIFQVTGGKVVRSWVETDRLGFLMSVGVIPYDPAYGPPPLPVP